VAVADGPTVVRFPKGAVPQDIPAIERRGGVDVLARSGDEDVLVVGVGSMVPTCLEVATRLADHGIGATVVDPRWVVPLPDELVALAARHRMVVLAEDNGVVGGIGVALRQRLAEAGVVTPLRTFGVPQQFLDHASRSQVLEAVGLTAQSIGREVVEAVAGLDDAVRPLTSVDGDGRAVQ
jgi:1-deoxy-D-xylulose-5-phosphate synthase